MYDAAGFAVARKISEPGSAYAAPILVWVAMSVSSDFGSPRFGTLIRAARAIVPAGAPIHRSEPNSSCTNCPTVAPVCRLTSSPSSHPNVSAW